VVKMEVGLLYARGGTTVSLVQLAGWGREGGRSRSGRLGEKRLVRNRTPDCPTYSSVTIVTELSRLMTV